MGFLFNLISMPIFVPPSVPTLSRSQFRKVPGLLPDLQNESMVQYLYVEYKLRFVTVEI